jgi:hypothetical protein
MSFADRHRTGRPHAQTPAPAAIPVSLLAECAHHLTAASCTIPTGSISTKNIARCSSVNVCGKCFGQDSMSSCGCHEFLPHTTRGPFMHLARSRKSTRPSWPCNVSPLQPAPQQIAGRVAHRNLPQVFSLKPGQPLGYNHRRGNVQLFPTASFFGS